MTTSNRHGLSPASIETIAGLSAGLVSTIVVHPLDIIKTRLQGIMFAHSLFTSAKPPQSTHLHTHYSTHPEQSFETSFEMKAPRG
jgi:Mitochondrial carrier protein